MAEVQNPVVPLTEPVVPEQTSAPVATEITTGSATAPAVVEPTVEETKPVVTEPLATEAKAEETKIAEPTKEVEPVTSGALGYKAPGLVKSLLFSKKYFWVGDEAVPTSSLTGYLRGEKPDVAHPTAAWSSQTGKGLIYFAKHADEKKTPAGVLNLSEVSDLSKDGHNEFSFKLHGHKHAFQAKTTPERDGWFLTIEKEVEQAKAAAEGVKSGESYKESLEKLKPAAPAAAIATSAKKEEAAQKKSTDLDRAAEASVPARTGSSSSDEEKKASKSKSKSRSVSRSKRGSIFGSLIGKKDELKEKKEEKAEEKKVEEELKTEPETTAATPAVAAPVVATEPTVAPVVVPETTKPVEGETLATEPVVDAPVATETDAKPKAVKRQSVFGAFFEKVRSPTTEKKESDVVPAKAAEPVTTSETPIVDSTPAPTAEPTAVVAADTPAVADVTAEEAKPEEVPASTVSPSKEKKDFSFGKFFGSSKEKTKTPAAEKALTPSEEPPKIEEGAPKIETTTPLVHPADVVATEPTTEETKTEEPAVAATDAKEKRRSSFFGNLTSSVKKEKKPEGEITEATKDEKHPSKLSGLFRNPSRAVKSKKDKDTVAPAETVESTEDVPPVPALEKTEATTAEPAAPQSIGDVVPDAVTVGQAQPTSNATVQATA